MKVSLNLAQQFSNVDLKAIPRETLLKRIGAQLGAIEEVVDHAPKYKGIVVARVVSCEKHSNADKLSVCLIDDGRVVKGVNRNKDGLVQVVCGAPNVRAGLLVAWIPPGVVVPSTIDRDPLTLDAREIRGVVSNGMLASAKELGISDDHGSILEIEPDELGEHVRKPKPGDPLVKYFGLDDFVVTCENKMFTHRPDCFGNLGVAREMAGISGQKFKSPSWYLDQVESKKYKVESPLKLKVQNPVGKLVPRFMTAAMSGVTVGKSPVWLQALLTRVGIKPTNNVVDATNFVMHLTGQPLHAFDYDKLASTQLGPRMAKKGEKLTLIGGKQIELSPDDVVIATDKKVVALAGVMGGADTEVDQNTKNIVLECATFDMYAVRRTSMRHGLFTEASTRYTKGQSPLQNDRALWLAIDHLRKLAGAELAGPVHDLKPKKLEEPKPVAVSADFINQRLGSKLSLKDIARLLENVEFSIVPVQALKNRLHVRPPFWRTDIEQPEDIVEEIGRLHGYDKLPTLLPSRTAKPTKRNVMLDFKTELRTKLKAAGANELLTYSFVHGDLLRNTGTDPEKWAYHIRNAISPGLQYYRTSLTPSLLEKVHSNIKSDLVRSDDNDFAIFEIGRAHVKGHNNDEGLPEQMERLSLVVASDDKTAERKYAGSAYYQAKKYLNLLTDGQATFKPLDNDAHPITAPYEKARAAVVSIDGQILGVIGEFKPSVQKALKLPAYCAGFELDIDMLLLNLAPAGYVGLQAGLTPSGYVVLPTQPKTQQDITFEVDAGVSYGQLYDLVWQELLTAKAEHGYFSTLGPRDIYAAEGSDKKRITLRVWLSHYERTLTTAEVNNLLDTVAGAAQTALKAERI